VLSGGLVTYAGFRIGNDSSRRECGFPCPSIEVSSADRAYTADPSEEKTLGDPRSARSELWQGDLYGRVFLHMSFEHSGNAGWQWYVRFLVALGLPEHQMTICYFHLVRDV
jgi:hypothetical protein